MVAVRSLRLSSEAAPQLTFTSKLKAATMPCAAPPKQAHRLRCLHGAPSGERGTRRLSIPSVTLVASRILCPAGYPNHECSAAGRTIDTVAQRAEPC
jgi:hypothetical protein